MYGIFQLINTTVGDFRFLLFIITIGLIFKFVLLFNFAFYGLRLTLPRRLVIFIFLILLSLMLDDIGTIITCTRRVLDLKQLVPWMAFTSRLCWGVYVVRYQALSLFVGNLIEQNFGFRCLDKIFLVLTSTLCAYYLYLAFFAFNVLDIPLELHIIQLSKLYAFSLCVWAWIQTVQRIKYKQIPTILVNQVQILFKFFIWPMVIFELISIRYIVVCLPISRYTLWGFIIPLANLTLYYCCRRIMGLRFLNLKKQVESKETFNFVTDFKDILEQLGYMTSLKELSHITQAFFQRAFNIPLGRTRLFLRSLETQDLASTGYHDIQDIQNKVEKFLSQHESSYGAIATMLHQSKILIKDEIEFTNFYEESLKHSEIIAFLNSINVDIFLPIYERKLIKAYIIVERAARTEKLYTNKERDEMLVFTNYVSNVINLLKYSNLGALQQREKELQEELYNKCQEINHYKESIRSFLRSHKERKIGIIFYKTRRFSYANEAAQELVDADINIEQGHPLAVALKDMARKVQEYKTSHTSFAYNSDGSKLVITGIPSLEDTSVIIMLYYPEVADVIRSQFELLKDPSKWDYILYLETTQSGQLINQLIPGTGEKLLDFKINLLEAALNKKATLLEIPEDDLLPTVQILHHISMRQHLHVLKLSTVERNHEVAMKLFGLNPLLGSEEALLSKLDNGTLFIENIHLLSLDTQQALADFIIYGHFYKFRSDHKVLANVRIICSAPADLAHIVTAGQFSKALFHELKNTSLIMPSLATLPDTEVAQLAEGFSYQALKTETFKSLIQLSDKDKDKLLDQRPVSLQELKEKVHQILVAKSSKHKIYDTTEFDPAYHVTDPELVQAVRLGKKALKDPHIMRMLWNKFKNQNKIATLLGVNRSSVNRRCQEYNLRDELAEEVH